MWLVYYEVMLQNQKIASNLNHRIEPSEKVEH